MEKDYLHGFENVPPVVSIPDIIKLTGASRGVVGEAVRTGRLKAYNLTSAARPKYRILRDDLISWVTANPVTPIRPEVK